jgi:hypothetical protein
MRIVLDRVGAAGGAAFVVLIFAGGDSDAPAVIAMELLALVLLIPFLTCLWRVLQLAEGPDGWLATCALAAGLVDVTIKIGSIAPGKAAQRLEEGSTLEQALSDMNNIAFILTLLPLGVMMAAVALVTLRHGGLPRPLGWLAAVAAPLLLVNGMFLDSEFGPAFLLFMLWVLLTSVVLTIRREPFPTTRGITPASIG